MIGSNETAYPCGLTPGHKLPYMPCCHLASICVEPQSVNVFHIMYLDRAERKTLRTMRFCAVFLRRWLLIRAWTRAVHRVRSTNNVFRLFDWINSRNPRETHALQTRLNPTAFPQPDRQQNVVRQAITVVFPVRFTIPITKAGGCLKLPDNRRRSGKDKHYYSKRNAEPEKMFSQMHNFLPYSPMAQP